MLRAKLAEVLKLADACSKAESSATARASKLQKLLDQYECQTCDEEPAKVEKITSASAVDRHAHDFGSPSSVATHLATCLRSC